MLVSTNWLQDFIPEELSADTISDRLTMAGIEVDEIIRVGPQWDNISVGQIAGIQPHPHADRLSLASVQTGDGVIEVVCGAPNIRQGMKIALAREGARTAEGVEIRSSKIRGCRSYGMICSEKELGIGSDCSGIMALSADLPLGLPLAAALNLEDTVLSLGITPNRGDCLSIIGIAREIAALFKLQLRMPDTLPRENRAQAADCVSVDLLAPEICPRYTARLVTDVRIQPAPLWMRRRLEVCGVRSINNIVDVTNYILLELGQPLHAFDYDMIQGKKIVVRKAHAQENFVTLDSVERRLPENCAVICDAGRPVAIGGIMGGLNSGVTETTSTVLIESAYFKPESIAAASRALKLTTESSQRFEKGVDLQGVLPALNRAASLMAQCSGGSVSQGCADAFPQGSFEPRTIPLSVGKTNSLLGLRLQAPDITEALCRLQMNVELTGADVLHVTAPSFRYDIREPIDLVEEVARIHGYDNIPLTFPETIISLNPVNASLGMSSLIRDTLIGCGFSEVINYSFCSPEILSWLNFSDDDPRANPVRILNPLASSQSVLRTTLLPSILENLRENRNNKITTLRLFEISTVFFQGDKTGSVAETRRLAGLLAGDRYGELWNVPHQPVDFYDIKGCIEHLLERLHIDPYEFDCTVQEPYLHPANSMNLHINSNVCGTFGVVHPDVLERFELDGPVCIFELDFDLLSNYYSNKTRYRPYSRQPAIYRDIALIVDRATAAGTVVETIKAYRNNLMRDVDVFDCFEGGNISPGKKSLAIRIKFQSPERTLTDSEVNKIQNKLLQYLSKNINAELRQ